FLHCINFHRAQAGSAHFLATAFADGSLKGEPSLMKLTTAAASLFTALAQSVSATIHYFDLKHTHAGQCELIAKRNYIGSDKSKVLRDERQVTQFPQNRMEEFRARPLNPMAGLRGLSTGRNMPGRAK